jgi:hypothetical protein
MDGGPRVFAASIAIDALQIALGVIWFTKILTYGLKQGFLPLAPNIRVGFFASNASKFTPEKIFAFSLLLIIILPLTPFRNFQAQEQIESRACLENENTIITHIGYGGTMLIDFISEGHKPNYLIGQIQREEFIKKIPQGAWWRNQILDFKGNSLLVAYQLSANDSSAPGPYGVFSDINLSSYNGKIVRLCVDKSEKQLVFDYEYRKLNSITVLNK